MSDSSNSSESRTRKRIQEAKNKARPGIEELSFNETNTINTNTIFIYIKYLCCINILYRDVLIFEKLITL